MPTTPTSPRDSIATTLRRYCGDLIECSDLATVLSDGLELLHDRIGIHGRLLHYSGMLNRLRSELEAIITAVDRAAGDVEKLEAMRDAIRNAPTTEPDREV